MVKVTVILTSYNKPTTVGTAIESVLNQTLKDWELYIMDDASNQETNEVIDSYLNNDHIYYFNSQINDGDRYKTTRYATLINQALSLCNGEYISYLTDDDVYLPNRLEVMSQYLDEHSNIDVVYSKQKIKYVDEKQNVLAEKLRDTHGILTQPENLVDHCSVMHRKSLNHKVLDKYGSIWDDDPSYWHNGDAAFWSRLASFQPFYPINQVLGISFKGPNSFQSLNEFLPERIPNGTLVRGLTKKVFLIDNQTRREISEKMLSELKYIAQNIVSVPDPSLFKYSEGPKIDESIYLFPQHFPNQRLIRGEAEDAIYYIEQNRKRIISNRSAFLKYQFNEHEVIPVSEKLIRKIPEGPVIYANLRKTGVLPDGLLFKKGRRYFLSEENELHELDLFVLKKLNRSVRKGIELNNMEFAKCKIGKPFQWKLKKWDSE